MITKILKIFDLKNDNKISIEPIKMTSEEFKQLETLLAKLANHLGHRYCILPAQVHDGYHIGVYDKKGDIIVSETWMSIETTVEKVLNKLKT
jgi:hypothetical protein